MTECAALIGRSLEDALSMLEGADVTVKRSAPPRGGAGVERVVRAVARCCAVELTACAFPELSSAPEDGS